MHVDQAGQQGPIAQRDDGCIAGHGIRIDGGDDPVFDHHRHRAGDAPAIGIEHAVGRDDQGVCEQSGRQD